MYVKNIQVKTKIHEDSAANLASVDLEFMNGSLNFNQIELETNQVDLGIELQKEKLKPQVYIKSRTPIRK